MIILLSNARASSLKLLDSSLHERNVHKGIEGFEFHVPRNFTAGQLDAIFGEALLKEVDYEM